jgi:UPF0176 protein
MLVHSAFYKFVRLDTPTETAEYVRTLAGAHSLTGSVLIAHEGINGVLAGSAAALDAFETAMHAIPVFADLWCKRTACKTPPFTKLKVHVKEEIVELGIAGVDAVHHRPRRISPAAWSAVLDDPNTVVIDNRNAFEFRLGHFRNAVNPDVDNFRDIPAWMETHAAQWTQSGKRVAMYCTGGIRCEKTSAWLQTKKIETLELEGGILNFLASHPHAQRDWLGECFVFDNRVALDAGLRETGTTEERVYDPTRGDEAWRLARALRLRNAVTDADDDT